MPNKGEYGTAANYYVTSLYQEGIKQGFDVEHMLRKAKIPIDIINKPEQRVRTELLANFQQLFWSESQDESMGLLSRRLPPGTYFMMGKLTVQQANLKKALLLGARFYNLVTQFDFIDVSIQQDETIVSVNHISPEHDSAHLLAELSLLAWHRFLSWLIADNLPLIETRFNYSAPPHANEYSYLFPGLHKFDCASLSFVFPNQYLERPVKQNEALLKSFMNNCPLELFRQYKADYSVTAEVKRLLSNNMENINPSINSVADSLYMTTRTITRRLKEEGSSFQQIKDVVRRDRAINLLTLHSLPVKNIAEMVGYSDPAVFSRAFKMWTGVSPKKYKEKLNLFKKN